MIQVIVQLQGGGLRQHDWISAQGQRLDILSQLMRQAARYFNLTPELTRELEVLLDCWVPGEDFPLSNSEEHLQEFYLGDALMKISTRGEEFLARRSRDLEALLSG